uniref:Prolactin releasing hormone n=1 Tax=Gopherus agassizii TaxID=38772 RepID=A0A452H1E4_9SAUR
MWLLVPLIPAGPCLRCVAQGACYWFLAVVVKGAGRQSLENRVLYPDIDPSWYTGHGIRPGGWFGRRRAVVESSRKSGYGHRQACFPLEESSESIQDE